MGRNFSYVHATGVKKELKRRYNLLVTPFMTQSV